MSLAVLIAIAGALTDVPARAATRAAVLVPASAPPDTPVIGSPALSAAAVAGGTVQARSAVWVWPLEPRPEVVRGFEPPDSPWGAGHRGVDLLGTLHQQVRSAGAGAVTYAGLLAGRGVVTISHGRLATTYEPVVASLRPGVRVRAGDPIGTLAAEQSHCAPRSCLHWGLLRGDSYLDPLSLLGIGPPRLLPLGSKTTDAESVPPVGPETMQRAARSGEATVSDMPIATGAPTATGVRPTATGRAVPNDMPDIGKATGSSRAEPSPQPATPSIRPKARAPAEPVDEPTERRARAASVATIAAPATGALAGAVTAALVVRMTGRSASPSPDRPPPPTPHPGGAGAGRLPDPIRRRTRPGVVDLDAVRNRLRGAA